MSNQKTPVSQKHLTFNFATKPVLKHGRLKTTLKQVTKNLKGDKCNDWSEIVYLT